MVWVYETSRSQTRRAHKRDALKLGVRATVEKKKKKRVNNGLSL